jgi:hypothetical protein
MCFLAWLFCINDSRPIPACMVTLQYFPDRSGTILPELSSLPVLIISKPAGNPQGYSPSSFNL